MTPAVHLVPTMLEPALCGRATDKLYSFGNLHAVVAPLWNMTRKEMRRITCKSCQRSMWSAIGKQMSADLERAIRNVHPRPKDTLLRHYLAGEAKD